MRVATPRKTLNPLAPPFVPSFVGSLYPSKDDILNALKAFGITVANVKTESKATVSEDIGNDIAQEAGPLTFVKSEGPAIGERSHVSPGAQGKFRISRVDDPIADVKHLLLPT
jgi:hypothetical protein